MTDFLKDYHTINNLPEGAFDSVNQNAQQLRAFKKWFFENKEQRLAELQNAYHAFCGKYLDYTPESLKGLGEFFLNSIETEKLTPEEFADKRTKFDSSISISDYKLTLRSRSLIVDTGIYLGEVMIRNHKNMSWNQYIPKNKHLVDRGYMVITINHNKFKSYINPIWVMGTLGWKATRNALLNTGIYELYNIYCEMVAPEYMPDNQSEFIAD